MSEEVKHVRRKRYSGKYPKRFEEKYKELNPEKYAEMQEHVKQKGNTPAGTHISIMVDEILEFLDIKPGQVGLDATLGYGGHTRKMLEKLEGNGHIYGLDVDPIESVKTKKRLNDAGFKDDVLTVIHTNFRNLKQVSEEHGQFDFILADLGLSSMQIDNPERGFSYKINGPLDFRMNPNEGIPASERLLQLSKEQMQAMFEENSDEPYAEIIAKTIYSYLRSGAVIDTTMALRKVIEKALNFLPSQKQKEEVKKACARCFQALRIDVNQEFEVLYEFMDALPEVLKPGGRVAILTFHSGEDRIVKKALKFGYNTGIYESYARDVIRPSAKECVQNPRAKSTKMRWAVKS